MSAKKIIAENKLRVSNQTDPSINRRIRLVTIANIEAAAEQPQTIDQRLNELDAEWDIERVLQTNASTLALSGVLLGIFHKPKYLFLTGGVLAFLLQHSLQGWCPPLPILRRMGIRTADEINQERQALRLLRGDFKDVGADIDSILKSVGLKRH